jgi:RNA polymerase sigma factor (sigma-70 family)
MTVPSRKTGQGHQRARATLVTVLRQRELQLAARQLQLPAAAAAQARLAPLASRNPAFADALAVALGGRTPLRVAQALCRHPGDPSPDDLAQEIRFRTWRTPPTDLGVLTSPARLWGWLYQVGRNRLRDLRAKRAPKTGIGPFAAASDAARPADPPDQNPTPHEAFELSVMSQVVREAVAGLPSPYREAVELSFFSQESLTTAEMAARLDAPRQTFVSWVRRGKARLETELLRRGIGPSWALA